MNVQFAGFLHTLEEQLEHYRAFNSKKQHQQQQ